MSLDGRAADDDAFRFAFSTRAGVRVSLRPWFFVTAAGEVGIIGTTLWSADVGFRVGS